MFRGTEVVRCGLLTEDQLRSSAWRRLRRDVYADARLPVDHLLAIRGVAAIAPADSVFAGLSAVTLWGGVGFATVDDPVEVVLPPGARWRPRPGVLVRTAALDGEVISDRNGRRRTGRVQTAVDLIRRGTVDDGVVLLDRVVHAGVADLVQVREAVAALPPCRGRRLAREIAFLADGLAESPPETRLRLVLHRAGLPAPAAQYRVFDDDGFVARVDFAFPDAKVAIEYDGLWHADAAQFSKDRRRLNRLTAAGWRVIFVTAGDLDEPGPPVQRIRAALAA